METKIKILKDTPFHKANEELSIVDFRTAYNWICTSTTTTEQLINYLKIEWKLAKNQKHEYQKYIGEWFQVIEEFELEPLIFIHEDLYYWKGFDGMYTVFISPTHFKNHMEGEKNCYLKQIHIQEARELIKSAKYKKQILYCTNDVNKKL